jgi:thiol-disulfide isomerase/thioredoxin
VRATFFDGPRPTNPSAPAAVKDGKLHLTFPSFNAVLDATVKGDTLDGTYVVGKFSAPIHAVKAPSPTYSARAPSIAGQWIVPHPSAKGEQAWRLIVHQDGGHVQATILRVDGDTGTLDGGWRDGVFRISHFGDNRAAVLEIRPAPDHQLKLLLTDDDDDNHAELTAIRPAVAKAKGINTADPTHYTSVKDPNQPFAFAFPDLQGHVVSNTDPRFRGKVVVLDVMGSWCPNCHDEAPFLEQLYQKRHGQGLEIVALDFEKTNDEADMNRLKAFIARYHLTYTVLYAGLRQDVHQKLPQAANLAAWPTTFFVGRDGRVKATHVGFTSPGSGPVDVQTKAEVDQLVAKLLAAKS